MPRSKKKGDVSRASQDAGQHLYSAAHQGDAVAVARLLAAGADPNASVPGRLPSGELYQTTALSVAAGVGLAEGESVIKYKSTLNVLTDTHDHSCCLAR